MQFIDRDLNAACNIGKTGYDLFANLQLTPELTPRKWLEASNAAAVQEEELKFQEALAEVAQQPL